jgi:uncharacterized protein YjbJ (UPF0337 family)
VGGRCAQCPVRSNRLILSWGIVTGGIINPDVYRMIMNVDEVKGKGKKIKGQIREEVGKLTGNKTEQIKGKIEQVEGDAQEGIGKIKRKLKD